MRARESRKPLIIVAYYLAFKMMNLNQLLLIYIFMVSFFFIHYFMIAKAASTPPAESTIIYTLYPKKIFNVVDYGAVDDGKTDNYAVFLKAWEDACRYQGISIFWVPPGVYFLNPIEFRGPCYGNRSPKVEIRGTLKAPMSLNAFKRRTWILFYRLTRLYVSGKGTGLLDGQGEEAWNLPVCSSNRMCKPYALRFSGISHGVFTEISIMNSKAFHMNVEQSHNIRIHNVNITAPRDSPNTDGIHIGDSANINITSSRIGVGDDCVSIGPGSKNILVSDVFCGPGHGISLGSLGKYRNEQEVVGVTVKNCTLNGTTNGVRIKTFQKSQPSKASNITFEDIIMINASNPIIIDQLYCPNGACGSGPLPPSLVKLSNIEFRKIRGTSNTRSAVQLICSSAVPCTNVNLVDINLVNIHGDGREVSICSNVTGEHSGIQRPKPCF